MVFQRLAATLEPQGGVRGPSVVAEDIVRAGLACRDMFIASRAGLEALAEEVVAKRHLDMQRPPLPVAAPVVDWARWVRFAPCIELRTGWDVVLGRGVCSRWSLAEDGDVAWPRT